VTGLLTAMLVAATWTDPTGHLRCDVPDGFTAPVAAEPWAFTRADGLRRLLYLTVRPVEAGPAERARQLIERAGVASPAVADSAASGPLAGTPELTVAMAIARLEPTWAGVMVLGPPSADVAAEAARLAGACQATTPAFDATGIFDTTRRLRTIVPAGASAVEIRGAGAARGPGWTVRLIALQSTEPGASLSELAMKWLAPSGAVLQTRTADTVRGRAVVITVGDLVQNGLRYIIEVDAVQLGDGAVGGLSMSTSAEAEPRARAAMRAMLEALEPVPPPPP
jgi:hypothetical protein